MMKVAPGNRTPIIVGEVLFDCFPDGSSVLGGAPFNVAWHLHGFGLSPLMVSAVGDDEHGAAVRNIMQSWGMRMDGLQINQGCPTGQVVVSIENGEPSYDIRENQAYDNIDSEQIISHLNDNSFALMYHGTLLKRTEHSKKLIHALQRHTAVPVFVDVNLRPPWWTSEDLQVSLNDANWVKLNNYELFIAMNQQDEPEENLPALAKDLCDRFNLELLIVTLGEAGAFCVTQGDVIQGEPVTAQVVDTVGAGDAFSSVMIMGLIQDWPIGVSLRRALQFAARICEQRGATSTDLSLYKEYLSQWQ